MTNIVNVKINKKIITFIILSIFVIFIIFIILNPLHPSMKNYECEYKEKFNEIKKINDMTGYDNNFEYKKISNKYKKSPCRNSDYNKWETRLPSLVKQRYSYNDNNNHNNNHNYDINNIIPGFGTKLNELPLNFINDNKTILDEKIARTSLEYYPDVTPFKRNKIGKIDKYCDNYIRKYNVNNYNPNDFLPAQYADRSKTSNEYSVGENLHQDRIDGVLDDNFSDFNFKMFDI